MPQFYSRPSFEPQYDHPLTDELFNDPFSMPSPPVSSSPQERPMTRQLFNDPFSMPPPLTTRTLQDPLSDEFQGASDGSLTDISLIPPVRTDQLMPFSGPLVDVRTPQSLMAALQSTMATTARQAVVIPGTKKRTRKQVTSRRRMSSFLRVGITLVVFVPILIIALLSFTAPAQGHNGIPVIGGVIDWLHAREQSLGLVAAAPPKISPMNTVTIPMMQTSKSQYIAIARQDAIDAGISPDLYVLQITKESHFDPNAVSPAGAKGIAQFEDGAAQDAGLKNPFDPIAALKAGARYMAALHIHYGGNYSQALAAYNYGIGNVDAAIAADGDNWMMDMPPETLTYVQQITSGMVP